MENNFIIVEGKTYDEAVEAGLNTLGCSRESVTIEVIEEGKSVLNVILKKYKIKMSALRQTASITDQESLQVQNENGRFEFKTNDQETFLYIYPPKGNGSPVTSDEIALALQRKGIENFDIEKLKSITNKWDLHIINIKALFSTEPIDAQVIVEISKDAMSGFIILLPPHGGRMITKDEVIESLNRNHVVFGIDEDKIQEVLSQEKFYQRSMVAVGTAPIQGNDGKVEYLFKLDTKIKPEMLEDGKVDFKELNLIQNVKRGDIVARRVMHTEGIDGMTVIGRPIKAKSGKPVNFKKGKNVIESPDGLELIADESGQVKLVDDKVTVLQVFEVAGNVDNATGNISFKGRVVVKGNVATGFKIECDGDIEVFGVVEGATLISDGNIILHKGIQGNHSGKLISKQDIVARYMENCYAKAAGNIMADAVMHCSLESKNKIVVTGKRGLIVGGVVRANSEITAKYIGSTMATSTKIEVGIDPELKERYDQIKSEIELLHKNKANVMKAVDLLTKMSKAGPLPPDKEEILTKSISTNAYLEEKLEELEAEQLDLRYILQTLSGGKINVSSTIYPGVKLFIGNSMYFVRDQIQCSTFIRENGEIRIAPYMG
ncbi:hypothetical protein SAMN02745975_00617 [Geosporobacter subterraneus DSM 17957]|uniref:RNA-binding protein KhpB N-terminal domain-containing protein n=1 Tax=Geosporobacter subterraneus DSM 17957 TaxID=1121919 RepID=A0A1M6E2N7_9FIRM|nr:FapA family protein [Geosporobacter subterraneus]SHI79528.1 hypothetical protein SAMN02745975_00617 [Geosporobacter subterraneus DSM 17957]